MKTKLLHIRVPESYLTKLDILIEKGFYPNYTEATRLALNDLFLLHDNILKGAKPSEG